jgi:DNA polymerase-3 subunit gamma/tau
MATQSLYRRYRPRRFSEIRGQEHVVRALRNAVINEREGQGYLFSGPRGTGKTTSARVLAKVLNCTAAVDGEPCCVCESCLAVEAGTSFDVHELDAASNNGVEAMRDLIEKASLGTPGRHKVYILDEVHMLSKGAEAALLKTLEEPPPHVVFVLATTDPQKVSATIRSRVQHLEFRLLPMDELEQHVRWVAADAGLTVSDDAFQAVLAQGGGSARDTLSALELVAASGGEAPDTMSYDEFIEAFIAGDPGMALAALAHAVQQGRDSRTLAQEMVRHLRDCFLSLMAPELVQLPEAQAARVADQAQRLGAAAIVRSMERLGSMLVEMRHAPDPRLLLDIALVQLTSASTGTDLTAIAARLERLERSVASGANPGGAAAAAPRPAPVDPATGRAALGGRLRRDPPPAPAASPPRAAAAPPTTAPSPPSTQPEAAPPPAAEAPAAAPVVPPAKPEPTVPAASAPTDAAGIAGRVAASWQSDILPTMKPMARALFSAGHFIGERGGALTFGLPNDTHRLRCEQHRVEVQAAIAAFTGVTCPVALVVEPTRGTGDHHADDHLAPVVPLRGSTNGSSVSVAAPAEDDDIDVDDLVDAPPGSVKTVEDRLSDAFPGSVFVDERN